LSIVKLSIPRAPLIVILVAISIVLLPAVASLQYHWVGAVSRSEGERMKASLRAAAAAFSEDFDREITRAYLSFQMDAVTLKQRQWHRYAQRYEHWLARSPRPRLVSAVFLVDAGEKGDVRLARFNPDTGEFKSCAWPAQLEGYRGRFERQFQALNSRADRFTQSAVEPIAEEVPALLIPVFSVPLLSKYIGDGADSVFGYTIATLDLDYLKSDYLPELTRRYFSNGRDLDYNLTIVSRSDPGRLVFQSNANSSNQRAPSGDTTADILTVRFNEFKNLLLEDAPQREEAAGTGPSQPGHSTISIYRLRPAGTPPPATLLAGDNGPQWEAILTHRAGSLEAAVAQARRKNLLVGFGVLLLLAVSVAMIVISTHRAQRLARQQMEFVAGVSHELRTPLAVICSAGENLADGVIESNEQMKRYGEVIRSEGRRLTEMVEQVLEFSGMHSGQRTYEMVPHDVGEAIDAALAACEPLAIEKGVSVEKCAHPDLPLVLADPAALSRSIQNLVNNAIKYGGEGRWIRITAVAGVTKEASEVQISVEDRGLGIEGADLPRIFQPFNRGRTAVASQIQGSGLGLSIVRHMVEAHGGRVTVTSTPGRGSSFTLHLPAVASMREQRKACLDLKKEA
jgi:signal transduction histidine kinase